MELLQGGNSNNVYKDGNTVVRNISSNSPFVHKLLHHLEIQGFVQSPRLLETNDVTERLSFIEGEVGNYPLKEYMQSDSLLVEAAKLLRTFHDVTVNFEGVTSDDVVCHNDFAPYNTVYRDGHIVGIIDFDMASEGTRIWDIAYAVYRFVPLVTDIHCLEGWGTIPDRKNRLKLFCDAYGVENYDEVLDTVLDRLEALMTYMKEHSSNLEHLAVYEEDTIYIRDNKESLV